MLVNDVFNHLKNAGCEAELENDGVVVREGAGFGLKKLPDGRWLLNYSDGVGEVLAENDLIEGLKSILLDAPLPGSKGVSQVVRRLVWYLGSDDLFIMRNWTEIVNDVRSVINIGSYNDVMLNFFNGQLKGVNIATGDMYTFKTIEELINACRH